MDRSHTARGRLAAAAAGSTMLALGLGLGAALMSLPPPDHMAGAISGIGVLLCCGGWLAAYGLRRGIAVLVIAASSAGLMVALLAARSAATQSPGFPLRIAADDRTCAVSVTGDLSSSLYRRLQQALDQHPATRAVLLGSSGGSALGLTHVARLLRARGVDIAVLHGQCDSACAFLWVSARRRIIAGPEPTAAPGFHAPHLAVPLLGSARATLQERQQRAFLQSAGLPEPFIGWAYAPLDAIWRPDARALNAMGVATEWVRVPSPATLSFCTAAASSL